MANPKKKSKIGIIRAEITPPAPNNAHQNGSLLFFIYIDYFKINQVIIIEKNIQAA
jgi:hypothetical protein